jgi:hypothetical protein
MESRYTVKAVRTVREGARAKPPMKVGMACLCLFHASKHKSTISKIKSKYRNGKIWSIPYMTKTGLKHLRIAKVADCKTGSVSDIIPRDKPFSRKRTIQERLNARICELCNNKNAKSYEIHHVGSLKKLGDSIWEKVMKKKRRKTLVVCGNCHSHAIHS